MRFVMEMVYKGIYESCKKRIIVLKTANITTE